MTSSRLYKMSLFFIISFSLLGISFESCLGKNDWQLWRGPNGNGVADAKQNIPTKWSATKNVIWKTPVPGRGHSSPCVVDQKIFLTTADNLSQIQTVLCFDRKTGKSLWKKDVNKGALEPKIHPKNTHASPSVASDGERIFAVFVNHGAAQLYALSLDGDILWTKKVGTYKPQAYQFGYGPSPTIYKKTVIVSSEDDSTQGTLVAYSTKDGSEVWRTPRHGIISYSSPIVTNIAGKDQLLISGQKNVSSYNPDTGKANWETSISGMWSVTCGTMVWDGDLVFASGGYPTSGTVAIKADGSKKVVWKNKVKCYEQSMVVHKGYLYGVDDGGIAYCWRTKDGKQMWRYRLAGPVSSSPILVDDTIYLSNEKGTTFVFKANSRKMTPIAKNQLGTEAFATPAICGSKMYYRVAQGNGGNRREFLYCIGAK